MMKATKTKLRRKGVLPAAVKYRNLNLLELRGVQELVRATNSFKMIAQLVAGNMALVTDGQKFAVHYQEIARLIENTKNGHTAAVLQACGYAPEDRCTIDLESGAIEIVAPEQK